MTVPEGDRSRERWQELDDRATPGPWVNASGRVHPEDTSILGHTYSPPDLGPPRSISIHRNVDDAEFIAAARSGWPAAEREADQLRSLLRAVRHDLDGYDHGTNEERTVRLIDSSGVDLGTDPNFRSSEAEEMKP